MISIRKIPDAFGGDFQSAFFHTYCEISSISTENINKALEMSNVHDKKTGHYISK